MRLVLEVGEFVGFVLLVNLCFGFLTYRNGKMDRCEISREERVFLSDVFLLVGVVIFI